MLPVQKTLTTHVEWVLDMTLKPYTVPPCKVERVVGAGGGLMVVTLRALQQQRAQWRSQDKQVTWPQHGHIQCTYNTHLLEKLGHLCHKNVLKLYITL